MKKFLIASALALALVCSISYARLPTVTGMVIGHNQYGFICGCPAPPQLANCSCAML